MKFSEAIRLGSTMFKQGFGGFFPTPDSACALGAALAALGLVGRNKKTRIWSEGLLSELPCGCPICNTPREAQETIVRVVAHLNDVHKWTMNQIADWVEIQENRLEAISVEESVEELEVVHV